MKSIKKIKWQKKMKIAILASSMLLLINGITLAHCDTMDGPVIKDAKIAIEKNNADYILKWVQPHYEAELKEVFMLAMKVRNQSPEGKILADRYLFETLVRLHRIGEGVPYTGILPSGTPVDDRILAADKSIEEGNLSPLKGKVPDEKLPELSKRFEKVMKLKNHDAGNVQAGREYVEAYVSFFKFAEGEEEHHNVEAEPVHARHE